MHDKAVHRGDMLGGRGLLIVFHRSRKQCDWGPRSASMLGLGRARHARSTSVPSWSTYILTSLTCCAHSAVHDIQCCPAGFILAATRIALWCPGLLSSHARQSQRGRGCTVRVVRAGFSREAGRHVAGRISRATCFSVGIVSCVCTLVISMFGSRRCTCQGPGYARNRAPPAGQSDVSILLQVRCRRHQCLMAKVEERDSRGQPPLVPLKLWM